MATHSGILAWRIPWTEEPGRLQSMGLQRFGHTPVFLLGESQGQGSLVGPSRLERRAESLASPRDEA